MKEFKYLGKKVTKPSRQLDTFQKPKNVSHVMFEGEELTCLCPVTGQPDFNTVIIEFEPDKLCLESKSLKLYLWSFRNEAMFAESLADTIANDIFNAVKPNWCLITIIQNIRGGMQLSVVAEKRK